VRFDVAVDTSTICTVVAIVCGNWSEFAEARSLVAVVGLDRGGNSADRRRKLHNYTRNSNVIITRNRELQPEWNRNTPQVGYTVHPRAA